MLVAKVLLVIVEAAVEKVVVMMEIPEVILCLHRSLFVTVIVKLVES